MLTIADSPNRPSVTTSVIEYGIYNVTIQLEWIPQKGVTYRISAETEITVTNITVSLSLVQLVVPYNTHYNVSIVATSCERNSTNTAIEFYYGEFLSHLYKNKWLEISVAATCDNPLAIEELDNSSLVIVIGYSSPALVSTFIMFHCPPGLILIGPESSMCNRNGEWEPDPREVECTGNYGSCHIIIGVLYYAYVMVLVQTENTTFTAAEVNCCQPPVPPTNGHILPYTNTLEGTIVIYVCWNIHQEENVSVCTEVNTTAVCNEQGHWELISQDLCSIFSG